MFMHGKTKTIVVLLVSKHGRPTTMGVLLIFRYGRPQTIEALLIFRHGRPQTIGVLLIFCKIIRIVKSVRELLQNSHRVVSYCNTPRLSVGCEPKSLLPNHASGVCFGTHPRNPRYPWKWCQEVLFRPLLPRAPVGPDDGSLSKLPQITVGSLWSRIRIVFGMGCVAVGFIEAVWRGMRIRLGIECF